MISTCLSHEKHAILSAAIRSDNGETRNVFVCFFFIKIETSLLVIMILKIYSHDVFDKKVILKFERMNY